MRGKVWGKLSLPTWAGITPAYAGKSAGTAEQHSDPRDHPRVCGEKRFSASRIISISGSPPRVRGKEAAAVLGVAGAGITPAYAGKSPRGPGDKGRHGDHPHVCGEKFTQSATKTTIPGSPPRMRGKEIQAYENYQLVRITPAYAGKSTMRHHCQSQSRDHPRVCGEKVHQLSGVSLVVGSPPRMRGKECQISSSIFFAGITPAYAGKRRHGKHRPHAGRDHPRVCGEKKESIYIFPDKVGSPPRMRGKAMRKRFRGLAGGITPAYAGKSR